MMEPPPYVQDGPFMYEGHIVTPIKDINDFYERMIGFSSQSMDYPYTRYNFMLRPNNLYANINYATNKAQKYFKGNDLDIIINLIVKGKNLLIDKENYEAALCFTAVCNYMHEIRER